MMSFRYYRRSRRGFTLLEVLIALTILSLGVVTLLQIFSLGLRLGARSAVRTESAAEGARVVVAVFDRLPVAALSRRERSVPRPRARVALAVRRALCLSERRRGSCPCV